MLTIYSHISATIAHLTQARGRDERGLSQSTENAILLAGAVAIAVVIITVITKYVTDNLPG